MVPQGPPSPLGGAQQVQHSLLRSSSGFLGGQGGVMPSQNAFASLVSPRNHFNSMNMLGNVPNVSALLHQSFGNGIPTSGLSGPVSSQREIMESGAESDPLSSVGDGMGFNPPSSSFASSSITTNPNSSGQVHGQQQFPNSSSSQMLTDQQQPQQLKSQNFQQNQLQLQQFFVPSNPQQQTQTQQQQFQAMRAPGIGPVKLEPQMTIDQAPQQPQPLQNFGSVKLEPQLQNIRSLAPVKMEPQQLDPSLFLQQQQRLLSRQSSQAEAAAQMLQQQRIMHQLQQQQLLKAMPQQRSPLQAQFQPHNLPLRSPIKPFYEPGTCARRLTHYMYQQQHRPEDNNIEFWRKFVTEYFAPNAKKKWCVSMYGSGRQTTGVFPQDVWHCEICNRKPVRGFEATAEVLPRLFKIKYESGTLEELLYVDMPRNYRNSSGQIVLDYAKAIQESVFEQLRVVRDGQLRIVFSSDLKICSWEFCARRHEELIPRRLLIPQVCQLGAAAQKYQAAALNTSSNCSVSELQNNCNMLVASARQIAKSLEVPLVNDLGYTKRYVRCLQISEVVNSMKDLIDYSRETGTGPMESLAKFPRRTNPSPGFQGQPQQQEGQLQQQQQTATAASNGVPSVINPLKSGPVTSSANTVVGLLHQNSMNSRQQSPIPSANSLYGGNSIQMPSPGSTSNISLPQLTPSFQSSTASSSNNPQQTSQASLSGTHVNSINSSNIPMQPPAVSSNADANESQSSVQKIINDMRMSSQIGGDSIMGMGAMGGDVKNVHGILNTNNSGMNGCNFLVGNGLVNRHPNVGVLGFGNISNGLGQSAMANGIRAAVGMTRQQSRSQHHQQDLGNQLLGGLGTANGFNNLQFD
ncbi:transcriptional corepressor SEUSS-like [Primulina tabacum]|uniref:transcriptional corepressor SEUSS-like n=1 Tax=Primulina tabacum TaxID=48773 RepID=UPI003F59AC6F